ncbi:MAG: tetratricopeptide repeat protein, partial [Planctomycetota bacterium]|jgi:tetratricopeptide (TPR) repeat protein
MVDGGMTYVRFTYDAWTPGGEGPDRFYVVFYPPDRPPVVYAARPDGMWLKAGFGDWVHVNRSEDDTEWGAWGVVLYARKMEYVRGPWLEARGRALARLRREDLPGAADAARDLEKIAGSEREHHAAREDFVLLARAILERMLPPPGPVPGDVRGALGLFARKVMEGMIPALERRRLAVRALERVGRRREHIISEEGREEQRLRALAFLALGEYPACMEVLGYLPPDPATEEVRKRYESLTPGTFVQTGEWKKDSLSGTSYRCEAPEGRASSVVEWHELSGWQFSGETVSAVVAREGGDLVLDFLWNGREIRVADLGAEMPAAKDLQERIKEEVDVFWRWSLSDSPWTSDVFFDHHVRWREAIEKRFRGDSAGAVAVYDAFLREHPGSAAALRRRMDILKEKGDWESVARDADLLLRLDPENMLAWGALLDAHERLEDPAVLDDYSRLIALYGSESERMREMGFGNQHEYFRKRAEHRREKLGDLKGAIADYTEAIDLQGERADAELYRKCAEIRRDLGQNREAIEALTEVINRKPSWELYFTRSDLRRKEGDEERADEDCRRACEMDLGEESRPYAERAEALEERKDFRAALEDYARAVERCAPDRRSETAGYHEKRARLFRRVGDLKAASREMGRAILIEPEWERYFRLCDLFRELGEEEMADRQYEAGCGLDLSDSAWQYEYRSSARKERRDWKGALEDLVLSVEKREVEPEAWHHRGRSDLHEKMGDLESAVRELERAVELGGGSRDRRALAVLWRRMGKPEKAAACEEAALEAVYESGGLVPRAEARERMGDRKGAAEDLDRAVASAQKKAEKRKAVEGRCYFRLRQGDFEGALEDVDSLLKEGETGRLRLLRAQILWDLRRDAEAQEEFRKYGEASEEKDFSGRAQARARWGDIEGALADLNAFLESGAGKKKSLGRDRALRKRGECLLLLGKVEEAIADLEAGGEQETVAWAYWISGKKEEARKAQDKLLESEGPYSGWRWTILRNLRLVEAREGVKEALSSVEDRLSRMPSPSRREDLLGVKVDLLAASGDLAGARKVQDELVSLEKTAERLFQRADLCFLAGDAEGARRDAAVAVAPDLRGDPNGLRERAALRLAHGDPSGAAEDLVRAVGTASPGRHASLQETLAECFTRAGEHARALEVWNGLVERTPSWETYMGRARAHLLAGNAKESKEDLRTALSLPVRTDQLADRARKRTVLGDLAGAEEDWTRLIELPGSGIRGYEYHLHRAFVRLDLGKGDAALADAAEARRRARWVNADAFRWVLVNAAYLQSRLGREEEARADIEEAAALAPSSEVLAMRGLLFRDAANLDEAVRRGFRDAWTATVVARGRLALGGAKAAEADARRALEIEPDGEAWAVLAMALAAQGRKDEALEAVRRAGPFSRGSADVLRDLERAKK